MGFWEILEGSLSGKFEREGFLTIGIILKMFKKFLLCSIFEFDLIFEILTFSEHYSIMYCQSVTHVLNGWMDVDDDDDD